MSKAFVRESDEEEDRPERPQALPVGFKNYMTPQGHRQLQEELRTLLRVERPKVVDVVSWAAGNGDRSENGDYIYGKRRLREIDRRIRFHFQAVGNRSSGRPDTAEKLGSGALWRDRHLRS